MAYLEELLPEFRKGAKIRLKEWYKDYYIHIKSGFCKDEDGVEYKFPGNDLTSKNWELYKEPEPDWQKIIDNKCLCWFWDDSGNFKNIGFLNAIKIDENGYSFFRSDFSAEWFPFCRPVRRDEVTFYEDKEDDNC